jgi:hypothetical protein
MSYKFKAEANLRGGIYTPSELHRLARRLHRRNTSVNAALAAMRDRQFLHLQYHAGQPRWSLSGGRSVSAETAKILIKHPSVVPADGALIDGMPGQSWHVAS